MESKRDRTLILNKINFINENKIDKKIIYNINKLLEFYEPNNNIKIKSRIKDIDSAYLKYKEKEYKTVEQIRDLIGIKLVCKNKGQIYRVLKYIEKELEVLKIKDYIKEPKMGYKSLHVDIISEFGITYEIQIKTKGMEIAQNIVHDRIYKNIKLPENLKILVTKFIFNILLIYENVIEFNKRLKFKYMEVV